MQGVGMGGMRKSSGVVNDSEAEGWLMLGGGTAGVTSPLSLTELCPQIRGETSCVYNK